MMTSKIEDDLKKNGRRPQKTKQKLERLPQKKWKTTSKNKTKMKTYFFLNGRRQKKDKLKKKTSKKNGRRTNQPKST
jgi:hypothetical protein